MFRQQNQSGSLKQMYAVSDYLVNIEDKKINLWTILLSWNYCSVFQAASFMCSPYTQKNTCTRYSLDNLMSLFVKYRPY